jgi:hypothetical protein
MVAELWLRNVEARLAIAFHGWSVLAQLMSSCSDSMPLTRPILLDEIEAAARCSFALPLTSRQCTVVAIAIHRALRAHGARARVEVIAEAEGMFMHSYVAVGGHIVDPGDSLLEGALLRDLRPNLEQGSG